MAVVFHQVEALDRCDGDDELLKELITICLEDSVQKIADIKAAVEAKDAYKLDRAAHSLKSAVGNVGGMVCYEMLQKIEHLGKKGSTDGVDEMFKEFLTAFENFAREAKQYLG